MCGVLVNEEALSESWKAVKAMRLNFVQNAFCGRIYYLWETTPTYSETNIWQGLFPSYLFSRRQFHAIVILLLKSIADLDSGSLPRLYGEFMYAKLKIVVS